MKKLLGIVVLGLLLRPVKHMQLETFVILHLKN